MDMAGLTAKEKFLEAAAVLLSVAVSWTLTGLAVLAEGVPPITPVVLPMLKPAGRPAAAHVYEPLPPVAVAVVLGKAEPTVPSGREDGAVIDRAGLTARL